MNEHSVCVTPTPSQTPTYAIFNPTQTIISIRPLFFPHAVNFRLYIKEFALYELLLKYCKIDQYHLYLTDTDYMIPPGWPSWGWACCWAGEVQSYHWGAGADFCWDVRILRIVQYKTSDWKRTKLQPKVIWKPRFVIYNNILMLPFLIILLFC